MLNAQQIADARKRLNVTPISQPAIDRSSEFAAALGGQSPDAAVSTDAPAADPVGDTAGHYMDNVAPAAKDLMGGGNIGSATEKLAKGDVLGGVEDATLGTASDAVQAIFAPIAAPLQTLMSHITSAQSADAAAGGKDVLLDSPALTAARQAIESWGKQNPQFAKTLGDLFNVGGAALGSGALDTSLSDAVAPIKNGLKDINISTPLEAAPSAEAAAAAKPDLTKISDMIAPKPTIKQARIAQQEGRLFKGKEPGFFTDGTPDKIAASPQQAQSAQTIGRLIEGADKMDQPTLYGALQDKVTEVATDLKPQMEKTPINQKTIDKVNSDTKNLFKQQTADALATDESNVAKLQSNFKSFLKKSKTGNFNELWETAKGYDASVPDKVKTATDASPHEMQMAHEIWLQNRGVLRDAINDVVDGMGKTSQKAFSDMRDLYNAQHALDTTAHVAKVGAPSKLTQLGKTPAGKVAKHLIVGGGAFEGGKKILTGSF